MKYRILIAVGGTGGHLFPALTLAKQITKTDPQTEILFIGGGLSKNRCFDQKAFPSRDVECGTLSPKKPLKSLHSLWKIAQGIFTSRSILREFSPDLVIGFGSYHTLPTLLAAKLQGTPFLLHEANRIPGKVNRLLSPYAKLTGVHFPDTALRLKGAVQTIPLPLREGFRFGATTKKEACSYFGLNPLHPVILVFGGSQGAQAINNLAAAAIAQVSKHHRVQVLHFTGNVITSKQLQHTYTHAHIPAAVKEFENRMDLAWQAADLVVSRAGASTLAESLEFEVPTILIPYPHAYNHQESNADYMADVVGGAVKHIEKGLTAETLAAEISDLLSNDGHALTIMKQAMHDYKSAAPAKPLYNVVLDILSTIKS